MGAVTAFFGLGWLIGFAAVLKAWTWSRGQHGNQIGDAGYAAVMLIPVLSGILVTRLSARLYSRGWGGMPVRFLVVGMCALVAGLLAL